MGPKPARFLLVVIKLHFTIERFSCEGPAPEFLDRRVHIRSENFRDMLALYFASWEAKTLFISFVDEAISKVPVDEGEAGRYRVGQEEQVLLQPPLALHDRADDHRDKHKHEACHDFI